MPAVSQSSKQNHLPPVPSLFRSLGPSIILLGLALGSGELILWPYLSANYGLGLLWGALLGVSLQYVLNTEVMRYTLAWGESVFVGFWRLSRALPVWFIISTLIPWSLPALVASSGLILSTVLAPVLPDAVGAAQISIGLLLITGLVLSAGSTIYKTIEQVQKTVMLVALPLVAILTLWLTTTQDWVTAAAGLMGQGDGWRWFPPGLALASFMGAFAYSGAGGNLNLSQSYYVKEKGWGMGAHMAKTSALFSDTDQHPVVLSGRLFAPSQSNQRRWQQWWNLVTREHFLVFWTLALASIIMLCVLAYTTTYGTPVEEGLQFVFAQATHIGQNSFPIIGTFFLLLTATLLFTTQLGILESSSRIISENVLLLGYTEGKKAHISRSFSVALWAQIVLGIVVFSTGFHEPRALLTLSAVLNAAAMMVSFSIIQVLNHRLLPKAQQPARWRVLASIGATLFFGFFLAIIFRQYFAP